VPCYEDDWEFFVCRGELALKIKTALPRQSHVKDQARGAIRRIGLEEVGNGRKQRYIEADRSEQAPDRRTKICIIINDQNSRLCVRHRYCSR
jgi:hypothetical protein